MTDLEAATAGATHLVVAIPSQFLQATLPRVRKHIRADASVLSVVKSLHYEDARNRLSLPSSEILQLLGGTHEVCALCGPNIYHEMTSDASFAEATIGCADSVSGRVAAAQWHALLMADYFATPDANVIALGTGFGTGCGHGANVCAAIMRVGLGEMERFARRFLGAADARTFYEEACGVGDLVLTCTTGRGHQLAAAFVRGDEHTRDVQTPHARWAALEAKLFPGMCLPDWHSAKALKAFLAAHCAEHAFPLLCAIGRISHGREPAAHIVGVDSCVKRPTRRHRWLLWPLLAAVVAALPLLPVEVWLPHMDLPSDDLSSTADPLPPLSPADVPSFLNATCLNSERRFPLVAYGAVLMRGFAVEEAAQFERFAMAYTDRLDNIYLGTSPRESVNNFASYLDARCPRYARAS
ncbi:NAD-dependent glycerol-3-phosphate dehydrogenase [Emiliania huxleyi CCMP1516]|uniref:glycerol-3-phosphate dehydrogenase (NAD(+)) n=2 Tax=Emiliania huxleyi TaxID=2903 RepID=A0A0D3J6J9_EMIH1|nr:NAD-dependent glycerol-3-phosphate dehydrogenase [Emiliania huxleyi CCMP1516]EOD19134.1 NAD-dependent glycerol-3-phosphate dehydrogenase [Emiliania huxleyi CCMP1516]|eukprot:XP_005771563.1 NAD-dependent glycerol-3-phosphate dehydrogenase [Emiliania huxleyi CCMP1516]